MTNKVEITKSFKLTYTDLPAFEIEFAFSNDGCFADIKENGKSVWTLYSHTEKGIRSKVTKWCKENCF